MVFLPCFWQHAKHDHKDCIHQGSLDVVSCWQVIRVICGQQPGCKRIADGLHGAPSYLLEVFERHCRDCCVVLCQVQNAFQNMKVEPTKSTDEWLDLGNG